MLKIIATLLLSRSSADHYFDHASQTTLVTRGCTQTAHLMAARLEVDRTGRRWIVFVDSNGEEEGECEVR